MASWWTDNFSCDSLPVERCKSLRKKTKNPARCSSVSPSASCEPGGRVRKVRVRILICWSFRPDCGRAHLSTWSSSSLGAGPRDGRTDGQVDGAPSRCIHARLQALIDKRRRKDSPPLGPTCFKQFVSRADRTSAQLLHSGPKLWPSSSLTTTSVLKHSILPISPL